MLKWLVLTSLRHRLAVAVLAAVFLLFGSRVVKTTPLDVFPEFSPPLVEIQTEAPGLSTSQVEALVTGPIESALGGVPWLKTLRSKSVLGLSSVVLIFEERTDLLRARQLVHERLTSLRAALPDIAGAPTVMPPLSSLSRILKIGMTSRTVSILDLSTLAEWTVRPRLMAVAGVANVAIWGERKREVQILVDPQRLPSAGVRLDEVEAAAADALRTAPGGFVDTYNARLPVTLRALSSRTEDLASVPVRFRNGIPLRLGDVAETRAGHAPLIGDAVVNDGPGLLLVVEKQPWANTLEVTQGVEAALNALRPGLSGVEVDTTIFRPATFIEQAVENLRGALLIGCALVIVVLASFLLEWRAAFISCLAIPLSLLAAALVLHFRGGTLNTMVLAGLVIALGEVVDDAIIDVENIHRRLRLNAACAFKESPLQVVLKASLEVRSAVVFASMVVVLVFVPVFFLPGVPGAFFRPLASAYVIAVLASLLVALTVTPALSLLLLPRATDRGESRMVAALKRTLRNCLEPTLLGPRRVAATLALVLAATGAVVPLLGEEFLPKFREYDFLMHWVGKPGASVEAMYRSIVKVSKELRGIPGVRNFGSHIGRAEAGDEVVGPNFAELWISVDPAADYDTTVARIQSVVESYPGVTSDLLTYLRERTKEVVSGAGASIVVRISGPDLDALRAKAHEVAAALSTIEGIADLQIEPQVLVPQVEVTPRADATRLGIGPGRIRHTVATYIRGTKVGEIYDEQAVIGVVVRGVDRLRQDPTGLLDIRIDTPFGTAVPLTEAAQVRIVPTPNIIPHEGSSRKLDVKCNVQGRDLGAFARDVEAKVGAVGFDHGYHPEILGEYAARSEARDRLVALGALSLLGIFLLLHADFRSARLAGLVFASLPFALVGGVAAVILTGGRVSLGSLVGFITVLGIAARNGILLVSHFRHLETEEGMPFGPALVLRGAEERLAPILMTALATGLALLPLALTGDRPGHEVEHPMALVILGGLATSTALNLLGMPALYLLFGKAQSTGSTIP